MKTVLDNLKGKLVVSCQALENEPLTARLLCRMALAAAQGRLPRSAPTAWWILRLSKGWSHCR